MKYNERLKLEREKNNLTQKNIGEICHVSDAAVGHWESGRRTISVDMLILLAKTYHVSTDYLLCLTNDPTPPELL